MGEKQDGLHMVKMCNELNMYHKVQTDKAREVFAVHNLLPTFSTINGIKKVQKEVTY